MSVLRFGIAHLSPPELGLVKAFFRLYSQDPGFRWTIVEGPPYDALLVDDSVYEKEQQPLETRKSEAVLKVTAAGSDLPSTLERPLRSDHLEAWLKKVEYDLQQRLQTAESSQQAMESRDKPLIESIEPVAHLTVHFRLRRWPSAVLLDADPIRIRIATLLLRRPLCLDELSTLSQQTVEDCAAIIQLLQGADLIEVQDVPKLANPAMVSKVANRAIQGGLVGRFREKLGL